MASTSGTRRGGDAATRMAEKAAAARAAAAAAERRRRRLLQLGGAVALAAAVVVAVALASGDGGSGPEKRAGETVAGAIETAALVRGIPQDGATLGEPGAPVTLVEFGDLQCPFCKHASDSVLPEIVERYVRTGKVKIVFRPVAILGDDSVRAAQMAAAAGEQDRLWEYTHLFYVNQGPEHSGYVTDDFLREIGGGVRGLDVERAMGAREDPAAQRAVSDAQAEWSAHGLTYTPAFLVGTGEDDLTVVDTSNDLTAETLSGPIEDLLAQQR